MDEAIQCREVKDEDAEDFVEQRNHIFGKTTVEGWRRRNQENTTAIVAVHGGKIIGSITLSFTEICIGPQLWISVAYMGAVGVEEAMRNRHIGSDMLDYVKGFTKSRCQAIFVRSGDYMNPAYRFYRRNRFQDLRISRIFHLKEPKEYPPQENCRMRDKNEIVTRESELTGLFRSAYKEYEVYPQRAPGYWRNHIGSDTKFLAYESGGVLQGYAIVQGFNIMELAAKDGDRMIVRSLLEAISTDAHGQGGKVQMRGPNDLPFAEEYPKLGFREDRGRPILMGYVVDPGEIVRRRLEHEPELEPMRIIAWTPGKEVVLYPGEGTIPEEVVLEMSEDTLHLLLLFRVDLRSAIREERITVKHWRENLVERLARRLPFKKWIYDSIDLH